MFPLFGDEGAVQEGVKEVLEMSLVRYFEVFQHGVVNAVRTNSFAFGFGDAAIDFFCGDEVVEDTVSAGSDTGYDGVL